MMRKKRGAAGPFIVSKSTVFDRLLLVLLAVLIWGNAYRILPVTVQALPTAAATSRTAAAKQSTAEPTAATQVSIPQEVVTALAAAPISTPPRSCTAVTLYQSPGTLPLSSDSPVLTKVIEPAAEYQIYGNTLGELRAAILNCQIRRQNAGSYHAITARQLNWSYSIATLGDGTCKLSDLHIGLHVAQLLPAYTPTATTDAATRTIWERYIQNLRTHENGHVARAVQYTEQLAAQLQALPAADCSQIRTTVANTINAAAAAMNASDTDYDASTGHGATQGAVL